MKKKKKSSRKKIDMNKLNYIIGLIGILFSVWGISNGVYYWGIDNHNIDMAYNVCVLENDINRHFNYSLYNYRETYDKGKSGIVQPLSEYYHNSVYNKDVLMLLIGSSFLFAYSLNMVIHYDRKSK